MVLFVIAGEASGDMIGAALIRSLRHQFPSLTFKGIGGPRMEEEGRFTSLVPLSTLSHMGIANILKHLPSLWSLLKTTVRTIHTTHAMGLLTIDSPEFCLRVSRRIHHIPRIHCVPPAVWAWRAKRAQSIQKSTDLLLSLFPFEAPYFAHMPYAFVGHPVLELPKGDPQRFWAKQGRSPSPLLCLLPGSREREIREFLPTFLETAHRLKSQIPSLHIVIPTIESLFQLVTALAPNYSVLIEEKEDAFAASTVALAASGSVSLELAFQGTPMVIGYRVPRITEWILRRLLTIPCVALINIVARSPFIPECLQDRFTPEVLSQEVACLLLDENKRQSQKTKAAQALATLYAGIPFSLASAQAIGQSLKL